MHTRLFLVASSLMLSVACFGVNEKNWNKKSSKAFCKYQEKCNATEFYANFADVGTCSEAQEIMLMSLDGYYANCQFQKANAKTCLDNLGSRCKALGAEYDLMIAPCWQVWACAQNYTLGGSGLGSSPTTSAL